MARRSKVCLAEVPQGTTYQAIQAPDCIEAVKRAYEGGVLSSDKLQGISRAWEHEVCVDGDVVWMA